MGIFIRIQAKPLRKPNKTMSILPLLASSLGRRDEVPNQELAKQIVTGNDTGAMQELAENLNAKSKAIQSDCIKVIDEIAKLNPKMAAPFSNELVAQLDSKNNRMQWGAMTALNAITNDNPKVIYMALAKIFNVADAGSVITNDHCVGILVKLCAVPDYSDDAFSLLNERLLKSPTNQLPMYAEYALPIITDKNRALFIRTLSSRLSEIEKDTKRIRVEKIIKKVTQ
jgi:hypothetical protein